MPSGTIKRLVRDRGFGFIRDDGGQEWFFHRSSVQGSFESLNEGQRVSFDEFAKALAAGIDKLLAEPERAVEILGAIQSQATMQRLQSAPQAGSAPDPDRSISARGRPSASRRTSRG